MSLAAEILVIWVFGVPSAVVLYASLGSRVAGRRLARRRAAAPAAVVSIAQARQRRANAAREQRHEAPLSA
jgi:hypothetical protein